MKGKKRCRLHGGKNKGAPKGPANGSYRTGLHTIEAKAERAAIRDLIRRCMSELGTM